MRFGLFALTWKTLEEKSHSTCYHFYHRNIAVDKIHYITPFKDEDSPQKTLPRKMDPEEATCSHKQLKSICEQHTMHFVIAFAFTSKANSSSKCAQDLSSVLPPSFILPFYPLFTVPILFLFLIVMFYMHILHKPIWKAVRPMQISRCVN